MWKSYFTFNVIFIANLKCKRIFSLFEVPSPPLPYHSPLEPQQPILFAGPTKPSLYSSHYNITLIVWLLRTAAINPTPSVPHNLPTTTAMGRMGIAEVCIIPQRGIHFPFTYPLSPVRSPHQATELVRQCCSSATKCRWASWNELNVIFHLQHIYYRINFHNIMHNVLPLYALAPFLSYRVYYLRVYFFIFQTDKRAGPPSTLEKVGWDSLFEGCKQAAPFSATKLGRRFFCCAAGSYVLWYKIIIAHTRTCHLCYPPFLPKMCFIHHNVCHPSPGLWLRRIFVFVTTATCGAHTLPPYAKRA